MVAKNIDMFGTYSKSFIEKQMQTESTNSNIKRNMLYFSWFRILPSEVRRIFYTDGRYASMNKLKYVAYAFISAYSALEELISETDIIQEGDCLNIIVNNITHEPPNQNNVHFINKDFLIPLAKKYCRNQYTEEHFYANFLAHESCAKFFHFLKEQDCWDNTRILIMGDHGRYSMNTTDITFLNKFNDTGLSPESLIPLYYDARF